MKNYYAGYKGTCYAFKRKIHRDSAVSAYGFEPLTANQALRKFGYTDSCSKYVIDCRQVSAKTEEVLALLQQTVNDSNGRH